ncbi:hypothetical protein ABLT15_35705 [Paraburkholderia tropica]|uniref:hypothetical protein n=1 Tax=Paraburkholderia tropica TaxID=92647 RepID=UPI000A5A29D9
MQWLPFPVRDFSSRAVVVCDTGTTPRAAQLCVIALEPSHVERPLISELDLPLTKLPSSSMRCASVAQGLTKEHQLKKDAHLMRDE